ncbi:hypothetical protein QAD02_013067 [Eretmocerus hayati]|uniref:Uncharacterized protein n=1 Tax=Eretmocerus hayati TaxID=131215 RepID=A0ACC2P671_9HYME|nr:hypothetical protein QAD02_013067 [Eretmocerus hayati]
MNPRSMTVFGKIWEKLFMDYLGMGLIAGKRFVGILTISFRLVRRFPLALERTGNVQGRYEEEAPGLTIDRLGGRKLATRDDENSPAEQTHQNSGAVLQIQDVADYFSAAILMNPRGRTGNVDNSEILQTIKNNQFMIIGEFEILRAEYRTRGRAEADVAINVTLPSSPLKTLKEIDDFNEQLEDQNHECFCQFLNMRERSFGNHPDFLRHSSTVEQGPQEPAAACEGDACDSREGRAAQRALRER